MQESLVLLWSHSVIFMSIPRYLTYFYSIVVFNRIYILCTSSCKSSFAFEKSLLEINSGLPIEL